MIYVSNNVFSSIKKSLYSRDLSIAVIISAIIFIFSVTGYFYLSQAKTNEPIDFNPEKNVKEYSKLQIQLLTDMVASNDTLKMYIAADNNYYYLVQLTDSKFEELKALNDYTYGKTKEAPKPVTITGMPVNIDDELFTIVHESFNKIMEGNRDCKNFCVYNK